MNIFRFDWGLWWRDIGAICVIDFLNLLLSFGVGCDLAPRDSLPLLADGLVVKIIARAAMTGMRTKRCWGGRVERCCSIGRGGARAAVVHLCWPTVIGVGEITGIVRIRLSCPSLLGCMFWSAGRPWDGPCRMAGAASLRLGWVRGDVYVDDLIRNAVSVEFCPVGSSLFFRWLLGSSPPTQGHAGR